MDKSSQKKPNRRQLLTGSFRYGALGLLAVVGGASAVKRRRLLREGKCISKGICRGCELYKDCGLPAALAARQVFDGNK